MPVLVLGGPPSFDGPQVVIAGVRAHELARAATEHLLGLGHATVYHVAGPQRWDAARNGWRAGGPHWPR